MLQKPHGIHLSSPPPIAGTQIVALEQIDCRKINIEMQCSDYSCFKIIQGLMRLKYTRLLSVLCWSLWGNHRCSFFFQSIWIAWLDFSLGRLIVWLVVVIRFEVANLLRPTKWTWLHFACNKPVVGKLAHGGVTTALWLLRRLTRNCPNGTGGVRGVGGPLPNSLRRPRPQTLNAASSDWPIVASGVGVSCPIINSLHLKLGRTSNEYRWTDGVLSIRAFYPTAQQLDERARGGQNNSNDGHLGPSAN